MNSRTIWLSLFAGLDIAHAPHFAPHEQVDLLPTTNVKSRVIRALRTPLIWTRARTPRIVDIATLYIKPRVFADGPGFFSRTKPQFVAGGEYILVENYGQLELWGIRPTKRLWITPPPSESFHCHSFASELQQDGEALIIASTYALYSGGRLYVHLAGLYSHG